MGAEGEVIVNPRDVPSRPLVNYPNHPLGQILLAICRPFKPWKYPLLPCCRHTTTPIFKTVVLGRLQRHRRPLRLYAER